MGRQTPHPGSWCHLTVSSCIWHFHFPSSPHSSLTVWVLFSVHNTDREWQNTNTSCTTHFICCIFYQNYIGGSTAGPWKECLRFNWRWPYVAIIQDKVLGGWLVFCLFHFGFVCMVGAFSSCFSEASIPKNAQVFILLLCNYFLSLLWSQYSQKSWTH